MGISIRLSTPLWAEPVTTLRRPCPGDPWLGWDGQDSSVRQWWLMAQRGRCLHPGGTQLRLCPGLSQHHSVPCPCKTPRHSREVAQVGFPHDRAQVVTPAPLSTSSSPFCPSQSLFLVLIPSSPPPQITDLSWMQLLCKRSRPDCYPCCHLPPPLLKKARRNMVHIPKQPQQVPTRASQPDESSPGKSQVGAHRYTRKRRAMLWLWAIFRHRVINGTTCHSSCGSPTDPGAACPMGSTHRKRAGFPSRHIKSSASQAANTMCALGA